MGSSIQRDLLARLDGAAAACSQDLPVQVVCQAVGSAAGRSGMRPAVGGVRPGEHGREVQPAGLPVLDGLAACSSRSTRPIISSKRAEAQLRP